MQDIRKPYTRSRSNNDLQSRVEQFEAARYKREQDDELYQEDPVSIPVRKVRKDVRGMDVYPAKRRDDDVYYEEEEEGRTPSRRGGDRKMHKISSGNVWFIIAILALATGGLLYTFVFNRAIITITPKHKDIASVSKVFTFSQGSTEGVPFIIATTSVSRSKTLTRSETRSVETKASGKITIYNDFDGNVQRLIKNTRFQSEKGKIYRINQSVDIPGKKNGVPGSVEVNVFADSNGSEYNIDSSTFSIPGFKGTAREKGFYAKTKTSIAGGASGTMSLVALSELNAAKDSLAVELKTDLEKKSKSITREGYVPLYNAFEVVYSDNEEAVLTKGEAEYRITATAYLPLAEEASFAQAVARTLGDYDEGPVIIKNPETLTITRKDTDKVADAQVLSLLVEGSPTIVWKVDGKHIQEAVLGKDRDDFKSLMKTLPSVDKADISFSPLWLSKFPSESAKIIVRNTLGEKTH